MSSLKSRCHGDFVSVPQQLGELGGRKLLQKRALSDEISTQ